MAIELLASAARTTSGVGSVIPIRRFERMYGAVFLLDVTAAASAAGDLLDVYIQSQIGSFFDDFVRFTQVLGNGGAKKFVAYWVKNVAQATPMRAPADGAMTPAGVLQGGVPGLLRVKYNITAGAGSHNFTFSVTMEPIKGG